MGCLEQKVAIVSGAASEIGRATARLLTEEGAFVLVTDFDEVRAKKVVEGIGHMAAS